MNLTDFILLLQTGKDSKGLPFFTCHNTELIQTDLESAVEVKKKANKILGVLHRFPKAKWGLSSQEYIKDPQISHPGLCSNSHPCFY